MATTSTPDPIPSNYRRVTPALVVDGAAKALEFYAARGFTEVRRTDGATNEEREPDVLMAWGDHPEAVTAARR